MSSAATLIDNREQNSESSNLANNSLFGYLLKPASIINESVRCSSANIEKLPNTKLLNKTKINAIPGGSKSVNQDVQNIEVDVKSMPETNSCSKQTQCM